MSESDVGIDEDWLAQLSAGAKDRDISIERLRTYLLHGISRSLSHRYGGLPQAEDVVQEALLKILSSLCSFEGKSKFTTWAMSIAIRVGISQQRRIYYRDVSLQQLRDGNEFAIVVSEKQQRSVEAEHHRTVMFDLLQQLIAESLTDRQRDAIRGTLDGLPIESIAERLQCSRNAIYKLVHDARLRLRRELESRGFTADDILSTIS